LGVVMRDLLKLFHPAIPHLTEELWAHLVGEGLLAGADWPQIPAYQRSNRMDHLKDLISGVRQFRAAQGLSLRKKIPLTVCGGPPVWAAELVQKMAGVEVRHRDQAPQTGHVRLSAGPWEGFIPLRGLVDPVAERERIDRQIDRLAQQAARSSAKLDNPNFVERAPARVVEKERRRLAEASEGLMSLHEQRESL